MNMNEHMTGRSSRMAETPDPPADIEKPLSVFRAALSNIRKYIRNMELVRHQMAHDSSTDCWWPLVPWNGCQGVQLPFLW